MSRSRACCTSASSKTAMSCVHDARTRRKRLELFILEPPAECSIRRRTDTDRDFGDALDRRVTAVDPQHRSGHEQCTAGDAADLREPRAIVRALREIRRRTERALVVGVAAGVARTVVIAIGEVAEAT